MLHTKFQGHRSSVISFLGIVSKVFAIYEHSGHLGHCDPNLRIPVICWLIILSSAYTCINSYTSGALLRNNRNNLTRSLRSFVDMHYVNKSK